MTGLGFFNIKHQIGELDGGHVEVIPILHPQRLLNLLVQPERLVSVFGRHAVQQPTAAL